MGRTFRIKLHFRRFARRHPWLVLIVRSFMVFSATFGGAYGFIAGARSENSGYDPTPLRSVSPSCSRWPALRLPP